MKKDSRVESHEIIYWKSHICSPNQIYVVCNEVDDVRQVLLDSWIKKHTNKWLHYRKRMKLSLCRRGNHLNDQMFFPDSPNDVISLKGDLVGPSHCAKRGWTLSIVVTETFGSCGLRHWPTDCGRYLIVLY